MKIINKTGNAEFRNHKTGTIRDTSDFIAIALRIIFVFFLSSAILQMLPSQHNG